MDKKFKLFFIVFLSVVFLDLSSKFLVRLFIPLDSSFGGNGFYLVHWLNTGSLFGIAKGSSLFLTIFSFIVLFFFGFYIKQSLRSYPFISGFLIAGVVGNLVDRLLFGAVTDFIKLPFWPAFNFAGMALSLSVLVLVLFLWRSK